MTANKIPSISRDKLLKLEIEANTVIYIHPKVSNEASFGHRQHRLVTYAS